MGTADRSEDQADRLTGARRSLLDDETVEALDELITLGQVPPAPGDVEEVLPQLGIRRLARTPFGFGGMYDALGDVIAQFVQHDTHQHYGGTIFIELRRRLPMNGSNAAMPTIARMLTTCLAESVGGPTQA